MTLLNSISIETLSELGFGRRLLGATEFLGATDKEKQLFESADMREIMFPTF